MFNPELHYMKFERSSVCFQITFGELYKFIERAGIDIHKKHQGFARRDVKSIGQFFEGVQDSLLTNVKNLFLEVWYTRDWLI